MSQLAFHWQQPQQYAPEDFLVSACNLEAFRLMQSWPESSGYGALITGSEGSGKTHLGYCWQGRTGAALIDSSMIGKLPSATLWGDGAFRLMENIETITDEQAFFHLLRHGELKQGHLLMTSRHLPRALSFELPDLVSRLRSFAVAEIMAPDDVMLRAYLSKYFADHQWRVSPAVIDYMVARVERSFTGVRAVLDSIGETLIATKREITIPLIKPLIEKNP